jgi:hypothetical protein
MHIYRLHNEHNDFSAKDTIQKACPLYLSSKFVKRHWKPAEKRGKEKGKVENTE